MMKNILVLLMLVSGMSLSAQSFVKQEEGDFEWRVVGRALFDGGVFVDDVTSLGNGVSFTDGRVGVVARFLKNWEGKVELGYSSGKVGIRDVYIAFNRAKWGLQAGHFFEPFGIEGRVGTADYRLMNGAPTAIILGDRRKVGVAYTYHDKPFTFVGGLFSDADVDNVKNDNAGFAIAGKVAGRPVFEEDRVVHLGVSARFSEHDKSERDNLVYDGGVPTSVLHAATNHFLHADVTDMINQWKYGVDLIVVYKSLYLQAEYTSVNINRLSRFENYTGNGAYAQFGVLLLGDRRYKYSSTQGWVSNPGAKNLELLFRYNITDLNDKNAGIMGGQLQDLTFGANYFINKYVAVRLNYVHASVDENSATGNGKESFDYVQGRIQVNF